MAAACCSFEISERGTSAVLATGLSFGAGGGEFCCLRAGVGVVGAAVLSRRLYRPICGV